MQKNPLWDNINQPEKLAFIIKNAQLTVTSRVDLCAPYTYPCVLSTLSLTSNEQ